MADRRDGKAIFMAGEEGRRWPDIAAQFGISETTARAYAKRWYQQDSTKEDRAEVMELRRYRAGQRPGTPQAEQSRQADLFFAGQPCLGADCWGCSQCGTPDLDF